MDCFSDSCDKSCWIGFCLDYECRSNISGKIDRSFGFLGEIRVTHVANDADNCGPTILLTPDFGANRVLVRPKTFREGFIDDAHRPISLPVSRTHFRRSVKASTNKSYFQHAKILRRRIRHVRVWYWLS